MGNSFLSNFVKKPFTVNEQIKLIHDFLAVRLLFFFFLTVIGFYGASR